MRIEIPKEPEFVTRYGLTAVPTKPTTRNRFRSGSSIWIDRAPSKNNWFGLLGYAPDNKKVTKAWLKRNEVRDVTVDPVPEEVQPLITLIFETKADAYSARRRLMAGMPSAEREPAS